VGLPISLTHCPLILLHVHLYRCTDVHLYKCTFVGVRLSLSVQLYICCKFLLVVHLLQIFTRCTFTANFHSLYICCTFVTVHLYICTNLQMYICWGEIFTHCAGTRNNEEVNYVDTYYLDEDTHSLKTIHLKKH